MNDSMSKDSCATFRDSCLDILELLDTPFSLSVYLQIEYNLTVESDVDPLDYLDAEPLRRDLQALALIKKNPWFFSHKPRFILRDAALRKFLDAEQQNTSTNDRLRNRSASAPWRIYLESARQFCSTILGPLARGDLEFSRGASTRLAAKDAHLKGKLATTPDCTSLAYDSVMRAVLSDIPHYAVACGLLDRSPTCVTLNSGKVHIDEGNVFGTVPKDWRSDRPICIEPQGNMMLQKAYGSHIRKRLRRYGYDIDKLQSHHGELARASSLNNRFATIDLSSASDTVSRELVRAILPYEWFSELDKLRCRKTWIDNPWSLTPEPGYWLINEKFSSMGNGFTFELETLLFLCLGLAVRSLHGSPGDLVSVYGDDIIVESELSQRLIPLLEFCGLSVNTDKTFLSGYFKESCGHDFFDGIRVRPIYLKELPDDNILATVAFANRVRSIAHNLGYYWGCDVRMRPIWRRIVRLLDRKYRLFGPSDLGDAVLMTSYEEWKTNKTTTNYVSRIKVFKKKYLKVIKPTGTPDLVLCCALAGMDSYGVIARGTPYKVRVSTAIVHVNGGLSLGWFTPP